MNSARPLPTPADRAAATAWIDSWPSRDLSLCPVWFARNRDGLIERAAVREMIFRQNDEWRARFGRRAA